MVTTLRKGMRVLIWPSRGALPPLSTDRVLEATIVDGRRHRRGEILVETELGSRYWRRPAELLVLG